MDAYSTHIVYIYRIHIFHSWCGKILKCQAQSRSTEKFFGCVRQNRGSNYNPKFVSIAQTLQAANFVCADVHIKHGNFHGQKCKTIALEKESKEPKPLPKRQHVHAAKTISK